MHELKSGSVQLIKLLSGSGINPLTSLHVDVFPYPTADRDSIHALIASCPKLSILSLSNMRDADADALAPVLAAMPPLQLRDLSLYGCHVSSALITGIASLEGLERLSLCGARLCFEGVKQSVEGVKQLGDAFEQLPSLCELDLSSLMGFWNMYEPLLQALVPLEGRLLKLSLAHNGLWSSDRRVRALLASCLAALAPTLVDLNVAGINRHSATDFVTDVLIPTVAATKQLRHLDISSNQMCVDNVARLVAAAGPAMGELESLRLVQQWEPWEHGKPRAAVWARYAHQIMGSCGAADVVAGEGADVVAGTGPV